MAKHFFFECNGEPWFLNGYLIELKGIDEDTCKKIANLHRLKVSYQSDAVKCEVTNRFNLHEIGNRIREIEFELQVAWGFVQDENWHKHWEVAHCSCDRDANWRAYPHHTIVNDACPVHGTP